jgi:hypothetical protein
MWEVDVTEDQADEMLLIMSQMWWKNSSMPEGTLKIWASVLHDLDYDSVKTTVKELVRGNPYWPSIAEFRNQYQNIVKRNSMAVKAIQRDYLPREENVRRLRELRKQLREGTIEG